GDQGGNPRGLRPDRDLAGGHHQSGGPDGIQRHHRPAGAQHHHHHPRRRREDPAGGRGGRDLHRRAAGDEGLLAAARGNRQGDGEGRRVQDRRHRRDGRARLRQDRRPQEGHDPGLGLQRVPERARGRRRHDAGRAGSGGDRRARRAFGRSAEGLHRQEGSGAHREDGDGFLQGAAHGLQAAEVRRIPRRVAEDQRRQDPAPGAAGREESGLAIVQQAQLFKGLVWLGIAIVSWGALFSIAKRTLPVVDPFFLGSVRYAAGVLLFIGILWITEGRQALRYGGRFLPAAVYGIFGFTAFNTFVWWGLAYTRPEHASIIMALQTPMTAIAVWLTRGLRPRAFTIGCIAVAIGGVLLVVTKGSLSRVFEGGSLLGDLLVFLGAVSWVIYTMAGHHFSGWSPLRMTVLTCIPGTIGLIAINVFTIATGYSVMPTFDAVWSVKWQIAYFVVFTVVLGVLGFNNGVKYLGALNAMLMLNLIPIIVFAIEAGLGRSFAAVEIGGAAIVIGALAANNLYQRRAAARAAPA